MPTEAWVNLAVTNGALLLFVIYLVHSSQVHQKSVQHNHDEWRGWLAKENQNHTERMAEQNDIWRAWVDDRDRVHIEAMKQAAKDRHDRDIELVATIKHLDEQVGSLAELMRRGDVKNG